MQLAVPDTLHSRAPHVEMHTLLMIASHVQVRNRSSEEYNVLKIQLEGIIEELERHFEQVGGKPADRQ